MKCKLCCVESQLKNSHVIPEFIYKSLYDDQHRFFVLSLDDTKKFNYQQKGLREKLLCEKCEQAFSKYERYASLILNRGFELQVGHEGRLIHFNGIDYTNFKLFALSILWRAGISSLSAFSQVKLELHEEKLRELLANENPSEESGYPFVLSPVIHENDVIEALIVQPTKTRIDNNHAYRFVFGGLAWVYVVSSHKAPQAFIEASIDKAGALTMIPWQLSDMRFIVNMAQALTKHRLKNTNK